MPDEVITPPAPADGGTPPPAPVEAPPTPEVDTFDDPKVETFDRAYVEKLRKENAERRTQMKDYEEAFGAWDKESQDIWRGVIKLAAQDNKKGAEAMTDLVKALLDEGDTEGAADLVDKIEEVKDEEDRPLTKKEMEKFLADRDKLSADEAAVKEVQSEAAAMGYKTGTAAYLNLLNLAKLEHNFDIKKAHEALQSQKQAIIDEYVAERAAAGDKWIKGPGAGAPPGDPESSDPKDWDKAKASMKERLNRL